MEIAILSIFLAVSFILLMSGLVLRETEGLLFVIFGCAGFILWGLNVVTTGVTRTYVVNDTFHNITSQNPYTLGFGSLMVLVGLGAIYVVMSNFDWD